MDLVRRAVLGIYLTYRDAANIALSRRRWNNVLKVKLYTNSGYLIGNSLTTAFLSLIFWTLVARLYPAEQVGLGSAVISAILLLAFLSNLGLNFALIRYMAGAGSQGQAMVNTCFTATGLVGLLAAAIFVAGLPLWSPALQFLRESFLLGASFVVFVASRAIFNLMSDVFVSLRRAEFSLISGTVAGLFRLAIVVFASVTLLSHGTFISWGMGSAITMMLGVFLVLPKLIPEYRPFPTLQNVISMEMVRFSCASLMSIGLWTAPTWILPIIVVNKIGGESNAYFFISWAVAGHLFAIPMSTAHSLFSEGSYQEDSLGRNVRRSFKLIMALLIPSAALLMVAADKVLLVFGQEYANGGAGLLRILSISTIPVTVNVVYLGVARVKKMLSRVILASGTVATVTLVLGYALLPSLGLLALGVAWIVGNGVVAVLVLPGILKLLRSGRSSTRLETYSASLG